MKNLTKKERAGLLSVQLDRLSDFLLEVEEYRGVIHRAKG
jgi:hypothetical protein